MSLDENLLIADVAERFYILDQSKVEIAKHLGLSRFKVARLLDAAREQGIVEITINHPRERFDLLASQLAEHLRLQKAIVVLEDVDPTVEQNNLGVATARYVESIINQNEVIGLAWGRTLLPVAANLRNLPEVTLVQLTGMVSSDVTESPLEVALQIRRHSDARAKVLLAPLFPRSAAITREIKSEPTVAEVLSCYEKLDVALLATGSWESRITQLEQHLDQETRDELDQKGAVVDFCGLFYDKHGRSVSSSLDERRISVSAEQLAATPTVISVASGKGKVAALHSLARTGLITCLATSREVALALLRLPAVTSVTWDRQS